MPLIHVYGFTYEKERQGALNHFVKRITEAMRCSGSDTFSEKDVLCFHNIRDVSPISHMYSCTFKLPRAVAFAASEIY